VKYRFEVVYTSNDDLNEPSADLLRISGLISPNGKKCYTTGLSHEDLDEAKIIANDVRNENLYKSKESLLIYDTQTNKLISIEIKKKERSREILGLDLSMTSFGWFLHNEKRKPIYGSFKTKPEDGIDLKRFMIQRDRFVNLINDYKIDHIGIEQPFLMSFNTEKLFALHQFILEICYTRHIKVVYITPAQIKTYATDNAQAAKNDMVFKTKEVLGFQREKINDDECDAYWVGILAEKFWKLYYKEITIEDLTEKEKYIFIKNKSKKPGILYKENISYYVF